MSEKNGRNNLRNHVNNLPGNKNFHKNKTGFNKKPIIFEKPRHGVMELVPETKTQSSQRRHPRVNALILDTNILLYDPNCIEVLIKDGNKVIIPSQVLFELDSINKNPKKPSGIRFAARQVSRTIEDYQQKKSRKVIIHMGICLKKKGFETFNPETADHIIIAQAYDFYKKNHKRFIHVKLLSQDNIFRTTARKVLPELTVEEYWNDKTEVKKTKVTIPAINVRREEITRSKNFDYFPVSSNDAKIKNEREAFPLNTGVICYIDGKPEFVAIRKEDCFKLVPEGINASNIGPYDIRKGESKEFKNMDNPGHAIALDLLLDKDITCVILEGQAGTGKTLMAMAAAIQIKKDFRKIIITRPVVPLGNKDTLGFLKGSLEDKMKPWMEPIMMNLEVLSEKERELKPKYTSKTKQSNKKQSEEVIDEVPDETHALVKSGKIIINSLDHLRGKTYSRAVFVLDEAQNSIPFEMKTFLTRIGEGTRVFITGDLDQIDRNMNEDEAPLDKSLCGLSYIMNKLKNEPTVAIIRLPEGVRSRFANMILEKLK